MKKSLFPLLSLGLLLGFAGCKDILDETPRSVLTPSFLGTAQGLEAGLAGTYSGYRYIYGNESAMFMTVNGTDEFMRGIQDIGSLADYGANLTPIASATNDNWTNIYRYINDANGVLKYAPTVTGIDPVRVKQLTAEAKLLRAHYYFLLVQEYGDVPLFLSFTESPTKDVVRAPVAEVYTAIIKDLTEALPDIPDRPTQPGRVTRATALHILAKVYLTRATSTAKQTTDYADAAKFAQELIDNKTRYAVDLETDVAAVHRKGNENGKEVLMNIQYNADATFTQQDPFNFVGANVSSFLFRSRYDNAPDMERDILNGRPYARFCPTPYTLDSYIVAGEAGKTLRTTDRRFAKWFKTVWYVNSPGRNGGRANVQRGDTALWYPGRPLTPAEISRIDARPRGKFKVYQPNEYTTEFYPVLNKYDDTARVAVNNPSTRPFIVYRLAETYLIAAEANMYLGKRAEAVAQLNVIRERAAAPGRQPQMRISDADLSLDFILDERTRELAGEHMRWFDLVRTGKLLDRVRAKVPAVTNRPNGTYGSAAAANIQPKHVLRPIPQFEIDRSGGKIKQNDGYN